MAEQWDSVDASTPLRSGRRSGKGKKGGVHTPLLDEPGDSAGFGQLVRSATSKVGMVDRAVGSIERDIRIVGTDRDSDAVRNRVDTAVKRVSTLVGEIHGILTSDIKDSIANSEGSMRSRRIAARDKLSADLQAAVARFRSVSKDAQLALATPLSKEARGKGKKGGGAAAFGSTAAFGGKGDKEEDDDPEAGFQFEAIREEDIHREVAAEREEAIDDIYQATSEINRMMNDLATETLEQGDTILSIEANAVDARDSARKGVADLHAASDYQKSFGWKVCIFFIIVVLVIGGIIGVMAVAHHGNPF